LHLDLVDVLRCPGDHDQGHVVVLPETVRGRMMISGTIGCPVCRAEYRVDEGVLDMALSNPWQDPVQPPDGEADFDFALALAAALDLTPGRTLAVIVGDWGRHAHQLRALTPVPLALVNPPRGESYADLEEVSVVRAASLPFLAASVPALAVAPGSEGNAAGDVLTRVSRPRARLAMPPSSKLPDGFRELARDDRLVVGERVPDPLVVTLGRRSR
jgi:uncharacterized protein YbaR (Trm112 family)